MIAIEPNRTALLVMDLQSDILARVGDKAAPLLERAAAVIAGARKAGLPVIYVVIGFRPGYPELNPRNAALAAVAQNGRFVSATPGSDIAPAVRPQKSDGDGDGEVVVVKHRVSAFAATDLDLILRARGIETLVLLGIATSGVVLSTVRHGADADYRLVVVKDACADVDEEVHRVLTEKVFPRQATVVSADEVTGAFEKA
jgi:nicotinamidase-related amidase